MRTLTIEDIQTHISNVLSLPLPQDPSRFLLLLAQLAATLIRATAEVTLEEFDDRRLGPNPAYDQAAHDWHQAHQKIGEICFILRDEYNVPIYDFCLSRDECREESFCFRVTKFIERLVS